MRASSLLARPTQALGPLGALIAAGSLVVLTSGTAYAYIRAGSGSGTGNASTDPGKLITISTAALAGTLTPNGTANLSLTVVNPYPNLGLTITGITAGTDPISVSGAAGCTVANSGVSLDTTASPPSATVPAGSTGTPVTFQAAVKMSTASDGHCQGATFTVPVAVTAKVG